MIKQWAVVDAYSESGETTFFFFFQWIYHFEETER